METNQIIPAVLLFVLIGMVVATGVLVLDKFDRAVRVSTTVISLGQNMSSASSIDFAQTYCTDIVSVSNATASYSTAALSWSAPDTCVIANTGITGCGPGAAAFCNITYKYGADNTAATALESTITGITPVTTTWLPLVITVFALAIILGLVITSFAMGGRK